MLADKFWKMAKEEGSHNITQSDVKTQFNVGTTIVRQAARVNEAAMDEIKQQVEAGTLSINKAAEVVRKAQKFSGVRVTQYTAPEDLAKVHEVQKEIMSKSYESDQNPVRNIEAQEFNDAVLSGVYDGKRYRRDMQEIQGVIAKMESLPVIFQDAVGMIGTLEQEKIFLAILDMMISVMKKASKKLQFHAISYDEVLGVAASILDNRFLIPDVPPSKERELLEELKTQYLTDCENYLKDALALKKRIKSGDDLNDNVADGLD